MANTTSANLKLTVQQTGENSGTWGQITNTNLLILEQAISGYDSYNITTTSAALSVSNGAVSNGKNMVLKFTGSLTANTTVTIPDSIERVYILHDTTTRGGFSLTFKTVSGTGVTLINNKIHIVYSDGTNVTDISGSSLANTTLQQVVSNGSTSDGTISVSNVTVTNTTNVSGITVSDNVTAANNITTTAGNMVDQKGEVRLVPTNTQASTYTFVAADHGKVILASGNITVPPSIFSAGQTITVYNNTGSNLTISRGTGVTMYWSTDGTNANRTLATRGVATVLCVGSNTFVITGGTLS
jgi:hypothetical protein